MEKGIYQAIVLRAIKDYIYPKNKKEIIDWVVEMNGSFGFCAEAMGMVPSTLREIMVDKMIQIDTQGTVTLYSGGLALRMRK